ncbi:MAG: peroxiredoxin, partial [Acinetobacter sp.]|nr:peroxiredoxin [Acinetobacter sp.]
MTNSVEHILLPNQAFATTHGEINLSEIPQDWLILYFYPKDSTPGCTVQATDFTAFKPQFDALNACVIGVSRDSVKSHQNFTAKQNLSIELISDSDETLCRHFDVIKEKSMYGKTVMGIERSTFIFYRGELKAVYR